MQKYAQAHTLCDTDPDSWIDIRTGSAAVKMYISNLKYVHTNDSDNKAIKEAV